MRTMVILREDCMCTVKCWVHYILLPQNSCWVSVDNGLIWAFVGPMLAVILVSCTSQSLNQRVGRLSM